MGHGSSVAQSASVAQHVQPPPPRTTRADDDDAHAASATTTATTAANTTTTTTRGVVQCAAWVCIEPHTTWSPHNVVLTDDLTVPAPLPHQVRIKVRAAGVNVADAQRTIVVADDAATTTTTTAALVPPPLGGEGCHDRMFYHNNGDEHDEHDDDDDDKKQTTTTTATAGVAGDGVSHDDTAAAAARDDTLTPLPYAYPYICGIEGAGIIDCVGTHATTTTTHTDVVQPDARTGYTNNNNNNDNNNDDDVLRVGDAVIFAGDAVRGLSGSFSQYVVIDRDLVCKLPMTAHATGRPQQQQKQQQLHEHQQQQQDEQQQQQRAVATDAAAAHATTTTTNTTRAMLRTPLDFAVAATLPVAAQTAYVALFDKLRIERGRALLVSGAAGGVGSVAVQLARHVGVYVFATCATAHVAYVADTLGANVVIDYTTCDDVAAAVRARSGGRGVDYLLEAAPTACECRNSSSSNDRRHHSSNNNNKHTSNDTHVVACLAEQHAAALRFGGAMCVLAGVVVPATSTLFRRQMSVHYVCMANMPRCPLARPQLRWLAARVLDLYARGAFAVTLVSVPFARACDALDVVARGHTCGKVVLSRFHSDSDDDDDVVPVA